MAEPEEQETPSEETDELPTLTELPTLNEDELYQLACTLKIPRRSKMNQADLLVACREALSQRAANGPAPDAGEDAPEEVPLTVEQFRKIAAAKTEHLELVLDGPVPSAAYREAVAKELAERKKQQAGTLLKAEVPEQHYRVTKGGRYIAHGAVGHLADGSVLTRLTHNLADVKRQGIEFEPCPPPVITHGMLGEQITRFQ